jgi:flagellar hook-associated protein 1 FlgK
MQAFFNSVNQLSTAPTDSSLRQAVLVSASNLASTFNSISSNLQLQSNQIDQSVTQTVDEIDRLTGSIATLNMQVSARIALGQEPGTLEDQRAVLISQLSSKIDVYTCDTPNGLTLTTVNGEPLVVGSEAYALSSVVDGTTGEQHVFSGAVDLTSDIRGGKLGGLLLARDQEIDSLSKILDSFAYDFANAANQAHRAGFDLAGNQGKDLFDIGATSNGAASAIALTITTPSELAASSDTVTGGNGNLQNLLRLRNSPLPSGDSPGGVYASLVFRLGGALANAKADQQAGEVVLNQLNDFRGSISGVSLDEESANLVRFQQAYQASARVIQTINDMLDVAVNLARS